MEGSMRETDEKRILHRVDGDKTGLAFKEAAVRADEFILKTKVITDLNSILHKEEPERTVKDKSNIIAHLSLRSKLASFLQ
jgi:hypothetical protein